MILTSLASRTGNLRGYWAWLSAFVMGAGCILAFAPFHFLPVLPVCLCVTVWLLDGCASPTPRQTARRTLAVSWAFGAGFFIAGCHWTLNAFVIVFDEYRWLFIFPLFFMLVALPAFFVAACLTARLFFWQSGPGRILALASLFTLADWVRGHVVFNGFPWNLLGNSLTAVPPWAQLASLVGVYGLTFLCVLFALTPALFADGRGVPYRTGRLTRWIATPLLIMMAAGAWVWGAHHIKAVTPPTEDSLAVRMVQPNFSQEYKKNRDNIVEMANSLLRQSFFPGTHPDLDSGGGPDDGSNGDSNGDAKQPTPPVVIWPETALPVYMEREPTLLKRLATYLPEGGRLLTGSARLNAGDPLGRSSNSLLVINDRGDIETFYDKRFLVPLGEYLPLRGLMRRLGVDALAWRGGYAEGTGPPVLPLGGLPDVGVLICYESIFTGDILQAGGRPEWLLNISNDAWFGDFMGPWQHFDHAVLRTIEEGLPMVRVANTGISALIDPYGRVRAMLGVNRRGNLDVRLPAPLPPTLFSRWGDIPALTISLLVLLLLAGTAKFTRPKTRP
ncbi:MAG: apolipoprotein N-acyltransferase [Parvularculales bacterium]